MARVDDRYRGSRGVANPLFGSNRFAYAGNSRFRFTSGSLPDIVSRQDRSKGPRLLVRGSVRSKVGRKDRDGAGEGAPDDRGAILQAAGKKIPGSFAIPRRTLSASPKNPAFRDSV